MEATALQPPSIASFTIFSGSKYNGLTIDFQNNLLLFIDIKTSSIYSIEFDGNNLQKIGKFSNSFERDLERFGDYFGSFEFIDNIYYFSYSKDILKVNLRFGNLTEQRIITNQTSVLAPVFRILHKSCYKIPC